jgi:hypothetical protein
VKPSATDQGEAAMPGMVNWQVFLVLAGLVLAVGCSDKATPAIGGTSQPNAALQSAHHPPADISLQPTAYLAAGMPDHDRQWSGEDMEKAVNVLIDLAGKNAGWLPRFNSKISGEVFDRLIADENMVLFKDHQIPVQIRLIDATHRLSAYARIIPVYMTAYRQQLVGARECVEISRGLLYSSRNLMELLDEGLSGMDETDAAYAAYLESMQKGYHGYNLMISGVLGMVTDSQMLIPSEQRRLLSYLQEIIPGMCLYLPAPNRTKVTDQVQAMADDPKMSFLRPELTALLTSIEAIQDPAPKP